MKILLLAAMDKEIDLLMNILSDINVSEETNIRYWEGKVGQHNVFISKCGIGKVNSALNSLLLIQKLCPDIVINSGVAGGAGLPIGTLLVADKVAYHDVWCGPGTKYGQADGLPLYMCPSDSILKIAADLDLMKGLVCSGDKFISSSQEISFIRSNFPDVKAVDMESASIAQTCILNNIPFAIIRIVSDTPGEGENITQYKDFWTQAPQKTFNTILNILKQLQ